MSCDPFFETRRSGINGESSFEAEVMKRAPGCEVWGYDFSVTSVSQFTLHNSLDPFLMLDKVWS